MRRLAKLLTCQSCECKSSTPEATRLIEEEEEEEEEDFVAESVWNSDHLELCLLDTLCVNHQRDDDASQQTIDTACLFGHVNQFVLYYDLILIFFI